MPARNPWPTRKRGTTPRLPPDVPRLLLLRRPDEGADPGDRGSGYLELVLPDRAFAVAYGQTEASLRRSGRRVPTMDLLIGVTARSWGMSLLARDVSHFAMIPGLVVESY